MPRIFTKSVKLPGDANGGNFSLTVWTPPGFTLIFVPMVVSGTAASSPACCQQ